jgi:hypothetical protein
LAIRKKEYAYFEALCAQTECPSANIVERSSCPMQFSALTAANQRVFHRNPQLQRLL